MQKLSETVNRKFIESFDVDDWEIKTDSGWSDISYIHKTIKYKKYKIILSNGMFLECADNHIVFDENMDEIFVKDCMPNITKIQTTDGIHTVVQVIGSCESENMYDLTLDDENHRFYTNDILSHNSVTSVAYILHEILFNKFHNAAIVANKADLARELLSKIKLAYEHLPLWLQQGICEWNKGNIELENGSKVIAAATSSGSIRGYAYNTIFLDEFAFVPENLATEFFRSVYPTITSGKDTKCIIVSTPKGMNLFYKMWTEANASPPRNEYKPFKMHWSEVPGRDKKWKASTIANIGLEDFAQEYEAEFIGSINTLINTQTIKNLVFRDPLKVDNNLSIYEYSQKGKLYGITVDVAEGVGLDSSIINVFDISEMPYKQVAIYKDNTITPMMLPTKILPIAQHYNNALVLVETNSIGAQVASILHYDLEYENLVKTVNKGKRGQRITPGFSSKSSLGVKTTISTKKMGCVNFKTFMENQQLILCDFDTIAEISTFTRHGESWSADEGAHDDAVMTCILFSWMTTQEIFKSYTNLDIQKQIYNSREKEILDDLLPIGFIDDGLVDAEVFNDTMW